MVTQPQNYVTENNFGATNAICPYPNKSSNKPTDNGSKKTLTTISSLESWEPNLKLPTSHLIVGDATMIRRGAERACARLSDFLANDRHMSMYARS